MSTGAIFRKNDAAKLPNMASLNKELIKHFHGLLVSSGNLLEDLAEDPLANIVVANSQVSRVKSVAGQAPTTSNGMKLDMSIKGLNKVLDLMLVHLNDAGDFLIKERGKIEQQGGSVAQKINQIEEEEEPVRKVKQEVKLEVSPAVLQGPPEVKQEEKTLQSAPNIKKIEPGVMAPGPQPNQVPQPVAAPPPPPVKVEAKAPEAVKNGSNEFDFLNLDLNEDFNLNFSEPTNSVGSGAPGTGNTAVESGNDTGATSVENPEGGDINNLLHLLQDMIQEKDYK